MGKRHVFVLVTLGLLLAAPGVGLAQKSDKENAAAAKELYEQGKKAYNLGEFDKAVELWKQGYDKKDDPIFLFNIAQAYRQQKNYDRAIFFYKAYLREDPNAQNRTTVEERIAEMQRLLDEANAAVGKQPVGTYGPGDKPPGDKPPADKPPADKPPGDTPPGDKPPADKVPTPDEVAKTTPATPEPARPGKMMKIGGIATAGIGVALVITGVIFAAQASSLESEVNQMVQDHEPWPDIEDKDSQGKSAATLSKVTLGLGLVAAAGGGVLFYLGMPKDKAAASDAAEAASAGLRVLPGAGDAAAGLTLRWDY